MKVIILVLLFNGDLEQREYKINPKRTTCSTFAEQYYNEKATHHWEINGDISKNGYYLKDGTGTLQCYICEYK